jgi:hypothetical protein
VSETLCSLEIPVNTSALAGGEWSASCPGRFTPGERDRRLGGPQSRSGRRGDVKILDPTRTRPARSQSLYRLRCPGSFNWKVR